MPPSSGTNVSITMLQMPALNTPQFDWVLSMLPRRPQPVPPIYQPEVAARAIVYAADRPPRAMWVGATTVATLLANKVAPGLLDRYLARTGFKAQQTSEPKTGDRPSNLWDAVDADCAAHGRFDDRAHSMSAALWLRTHRRWVAGAVAAGAAALALHALMK